MKTDHLQWWNNLRHSGLLLDLKRLNDLFPESLPDIPEHQHQKLRRELNRFYDDPDGKPGKFVGLVLEDICGFNNSAGKWYRGSNVATAWTRYNSAGEAIRPNHLWIANSGSMLPVFIDSAKRLGIGHGKRAISKALQWLRKTDQHLAVVTNGRQWRIIFAGLDYEAWCEWDIEQWFAEGAPSNEFLGFKGLLSPELWTAPDTGHLCILESTINEARKGQADLSQTLGERVRQAAELLVQAHASELNRNKIGAHPQEIYRAAVRVIMRMVVVLFAESREGLLPVDNPIYQGAYSLNGLREQLGRISPHRLENSYYAYARILALFRLIYHGSSHADFTVPEYGGTLFATGDPGSSDPMMKALYLFETACFHADLVNDQQVRKILDLLTRTKIKLRQGRAGMWVSMPVDFSSLGNEYIGILYEGLLDFELHCANENEPIVFIAVGDNPALPLTTLEDMDDQAVKNLLEKLKDTSSETDDPETEQAEPEPEDLDDSEASADNETEDEGTEADEEDLAEFDRDAETESTDDARLTLQGRAEEWARRACEVGKLVRKPRGKMTPEKQMQYERALNEKARKLITRVILPGEWYLVRWGGTRKGAGTFYTRPQLAIPTAHRTLMPLAYEPPTDKDGNPLTDAPADRWIPKKPEQILSLKVCDPACGSGTFLLTGLRFLTNALYEALILHDRVREHHEKSALELICNVDNEPQLSHEDLPCRPDEDGFEAQTKAVLRRYVVERCIYGVDIDPLAVELCRLALWIETIDPKLPMTFLKHKIKCGNSLVGAWFDTFLHYPAMAWNREGGDNNHTNGVNYKKEQLTKEIKEFFNLVKSELRELIDGDQVLQSMDLADVTNEHEAVEKALCEIHNTGIAQIQERAERFENLQKDTRFLELKNAFDLWCALWFWPGDEAGTAPAPINFYSQNIAPEIWNIIRSVAAEQKFFHWELEYPDVFNAHSTGFDAVLGNPPWDIAKPNSKEFFSAVDPLYRGYGKQEAINKQKEYFAAKAAVEREWLRYNAFFKSMANWTKFAGHPFGGRVTTDSNGKNKHDLPIGDRGRSSFETSERRHKIWRGKRSEITGYADPYHPFCHQGGGDINLYKLFLEQVHALLKNGGRMGLVVPSGIYSDHGTGNLRSLFIQHCKWEWLFGFENRDKVFDIDGRFKFNPIIIEKGGQTEKIRTAFMHRQLADWENGERHAIEYPRDNVLKFSPHSKALLEIQSQRDLEILDKIYSNSVLLGDQGPDGWGVQYAREFDMTNDSKLFPTRPKWEEWGYQPDEYSRWIQGPWQPIEALYAELGVNPSKEDERHCAQPPYDKLPIPRSDIPEGIILSRDASQFIKEDEIPEVTFTEASGKPLTIKIGRGKNAEECEITGPAIALPLYEGRMIGQFDFSEKAWVSGKGRSAVWRDVPWEEKIIGPQFLMGKEVIKQTGKINLGPKISYMRVSSSTNSRTMISTYLSSFPAGDSVFYYIPSKNKTITAITIAAAFSLLPYDYQLRFRFSGLNLSEFIINETAIPGPNLLITNSTAFIRLSSQLLLGSNIFAPEIIKIKDNYGLQKPSLFPLCSTERLRYLCLIGAVLGIKYGLNFEDIFYLLKDCDLPSTQRAKKQLNPKGFWRVDKDKPPEHRLTVLSLVAFHDLQQKIAECAGDTEKGIEAFLNQNHGEGWMLPETLRLADYGLGHDDRAKEHQPVRECFGPRFLDWQLAQDPEESWQECHLHARNLLGPEGYQALIDEIEGRAPEKQSPVEPPEQNTKKKIKEKQIQYTLFNQDEPESGNS